MDWLSQNWIWVVLLVGGFYVMRRMGGCGMSMGSSCGTTSKRSDKQDDGNTAPPDHAVVVPIDAGQRQSRAKED